MNMMRGISTNDQFSHNYFVSFPANKPDYLNDVIAVDMKLDNPMLLYVINFICCTFNKISYHYKYLLTAIQYCRVNCYNWIYTNVRNQIVKQLSEGHLNMCTQY